MVPEAADCVMRMRLNFGTGVLFDTLPDWAETTVVDVSSPSPSLQAVVGRCIGDLAAERGQSKP